MVSENSQFTRCCKSRRKKKKQIKWTRFRKCMYTFDVGIIKSNKILLWLLRMLLALLFVHFIHLFILFFISFSCRWTEFRPMQFSIMNSIELMYIIWSISFSIGIVSCFTYEIFILSQCIRNMSSYINTIVGKHTITPVFSCFFG